MALLSGNQGNISKASIGLGAVPNIDFTSEVAANANKLAGIAPNATANSTDAVLLARANHTGTQLLTTISDAGTAASKNVPATGDAAAGEIVLGSDSRLGAGGSVTWIVKSAAYTAVIGDGIIGNTSAGAFTITLPAIVAIGDSGSFIDFDGSWATNNLTIATTGANTIMGLASPMIVNSSVPFELVAISLTDWRLF